VVGSTTGTITSPRFHSFVLVVDEAHCPRLFERADELDALKLVDQTLLHLFQRTGMKMTVRERVLSVGFRNEIEKAFPLMLSAGVFELELNDSPPFLY
jgi:hypothetical protein